MQLECMMFSKISQSEKDKYRMTSLTCGKYETKQRSKGKRERDRVKPRHRLVTIESTLMVTRRDIGGGTCEIRDGELRGHLIMMKKVTRNKMILESK